jgi:hypothetical protein
MISIYWMLEIRVDHGPVFGLLGVQRNSSLSNRSPAVPLRSRKVQGVRRFNEQDESLGDGSIAAQRWRNRCVRQAADCDMGKLPDAPRPLRRPGRAKASRWPSSPHQGGKHTLKTARRYPEVERVIGVWPRGRCCESSRFALAPAAFSLKGISGMAIREGSAPATRSTPRRQRTDPTGHARPSKGPIRAGDWVGAGDRG